MDKQHVKAEDTRRLTGSVDVDAALKATCPNDPRWDYGIGHQPANLDDETVYWVEIHPASSEEVNAVLQKLAWLKSWLREGALPLNAMRREFIWVSSGKTSFTLSAPQQKRFASQGLQHKGRVFTIPNQAVA
ncbi:MAG TPA: hypothetical protein VG013_22765 [Gemmataceae bacterium]|nr:hypothetical protein [Gemmataceae bacterium]